MRKEQMKSKSKQWARQVARRKVVEHQGKVDQISVEDSRLTLEQSFSAFETAYKRGIAGLVDAANIYVRAVDNDPDCAERFRQHFIEEVPVTAWRNLEALGRKRIHLQLFLGELDAQKTRLVARLPFDVQAQVCEQNMRFPLLLAGGETLAVSIQDATPEQADQLVGDTCMRNMPAQRAYLEGKRKQPIIADDLPYAISKGKVTFRRNAVMTCTELKQLILTM
jgi:hypothetical protein